MALQQQQQGAQQQPLLTMGLQQGQQQQQQQQQPQAGGTTAPTAQAAAAQQPRLQFPQNQLPANLHVQQQLLRMQQQQQGITAKLQGATGASGVQQRLLHLEQQEQFLQQQQQQEPEKVHWVQCDRCDKWRVAPYEITLPSWVCEQNTWDRRYASCSVPEQPDPAAQMQQQQPTRQQQQLLQQQQLQQQQLLQQQRLGGGAAPRPKAKAKAKSRATSKGTAAVQRPVQSGNCSGDAGSAAASEGSFVLAPGLIPPADAAASAAALVRQNLLQQQLGQQQQRGGPGAASNLPALQQQLLQQQLQHQMQQAQQQQLLQQLQQQQHQLLQQLQQQPPVVYDNWVQCDACNKWRRAPNPITSDKWFCRMNTWAPQFASCEAPEEPDPAQQDQQQQQQSQQRLLEAAAALQRQQQQLQQSAAKRQRTTTVSRVPEATKPDPKADPPTQLLRQQQLVAAAAASGQRSATPGAQQQLQLQQQLQQAKLPQGQQQQHPGASTSAGAGGQLQQLQLLQQQQLQLLQQQQVRLLDVARRATPNTAAGAPGAAVAAASTAGGAAAGTAERREGVPETTAASTAERGGKWLECRSCKKWRRLPPEVDAEALRPKFYCYLNVWDLQRNTCASPQEPWQQLQQHQEIQGKAPAAANAASAAPLQKVAHQPATPDANRQGKADNVTATPAQQQQLPRTGGQLQGETGGAASLHQQLQEQQLLLLRMQQQQQRAAASSGVPGSSTTKPGSGASGQAAGTEDDDEEGEDDIEGEGDDDEDSEDTGDSSDSESDRGGGGGPGGGAGTGGPSAGGASGTGAGAGEGAGRTPPPPTQGPPGTGSFGANAAGSGGVAAGGEFVAVDTKVEDSNSNGNERSASGRPARFFDVLIVGGGVAGLAGALHCQRAGVDYQLIEARGRLGGRVWSVTLPASPEEQEQLQQRRIGRKESGKKGKSGKDGSVCVDGGASYMHGLTGNENDVRLKPRRRGCSVYHLAAASPECRVAVVPGETGWENPYYFDWLTGGRRFSMLVVSLAHALFSRLATPVSLTAGQQERGPSVSVLTLLNREANSLLETEGTTDSAASSAPCGFPFACEKHHGESGSLDIPPHQNTFESLDLPSALKGLVATLLQRLKSLCSLAISGVDKSSDNRSEGEIAVGECCACQVEAMVVRMLRSRFGFVAPLRDVSAAFFAFFQSPKLKRDVERYHSPKYRLLTWPGLQRYAKNLSFAFAERDRKKSQVVRPFAAIPPSVSSDLICMSWRWLVDMLRGQLSPERVRLNTRVSSVSVSEEDSPFPCLVRCHSDDNSNEAQELRSRFVLVALPVSLLQQPPEDEGAAACVTFQPPLPAEKVAALAAVGMGVHNKVVLRVAPSDVFWSRSTPSFSSPYSRFQYLNLHAYGEKGCILAHLFPPASLAIDSLTDEEVAQEVLDDLRKLFGYVPRPALVASVVTRWHSDKYSRGSYSYPKPGADMATHWRWLRAPHPLEAPRVAFAGEFCSDSYSQCVDGAFDTGMRAAQSVVQFGLRLHPCTKGRQEQKQPQKGDEVSAEAERLQQQHRNRRQHRATRESRRGSKQQRTSKRYKKETLDAAEAKARIATAKAELEQAKTKYCGDDCCPMLECPDISHAGFYLTDGSDLTDCDEGVMKSDDQEDLETTYGKNTRMMLEKFQALLQFNRKQLRCSQSRCSPAKSGPANFARPAQARA